MTDLAGISRSIAALAEGAAASVAALPGAGASAFAWRDDLLVTADEALDSDDDLEAVLPDGRRLTARLAGRDPSTDVALLRAEGHGLPPVTLDPGARRAGEILLAVGRAEGGAVAAMGVLGHAGPAWRSLRGGRIDARLDLDLRLPHAAHGGLVVDAEGRALGLAALGARGRALAIPAATVERVAAHLLAHGRVARGYLGVTLHPVRVAGSDAVGAVIVDLDAGGPAQGAGLRQGDVILTVDGQPVGGARGLAARLGPDSVGTAVEVRALRGGEAMAVAVTVGERPRAQP